MGLLLDVGIILNIKDAQIFILAIAVVEET